MDWFAFFFGAVVGAFLATLVVAFLAARMMRPFMRAAKERASSTASMVPPINWTSNEPPYAWPPTKEDADAN